MRSFPILALLLAGACGTVSVGIPALEKSPDSPAEAPAPPSRAAKAAPNDEGAIHLAMKKVHSSRQSYKIGPADLIQITVYQESDLDRLARVSPEGIVTFPLIGKVQVGGLDVPSAEEAMAEKLKRYLVHPQVSILIKEYGNKIIYVLGEVQKPGSISLPTEAPLSIVEAISLAGGFTQYAAKDRIRVIRNADGKSQTYEIDVAAITRNGDKAKDLPLQPDDVIVVPETLF